MTHLTSDGIEEDDEGFLFAVCKCGFCTGPLPSAEEVADVLMEHAFDAGYHAAQDAANTP